MAGAASSPRERDPSTIAIIVLENGHYYQVRIIPHPQESHWNLEAVNSMLPATTPLPDSPTPLLSSQPPDPLTAIRSGNTGTWHPGCALYRLLGGRSTAGHTPGYGQRRGGSPSKASISWNHRGTDGRDPHCTHPVPCFRDPPDPGDGTGRATAARHSH